MLGARSQLCKSRRKHLTTFNQQIQAVQSVTCTTVLKNSAHETVAILCLQKECLVEVNDFVIFFTISFLFLTPLTDCEDRDILYSV